MTTEQLKKIFLPFEQLGNNLHRSEGTGLGLAISSQIVELMGSEIKVDSIYGRGTQFWFDLDLQIVDDGKSSTLFKTQKNIIGYEGERKTILIIDNSSEDRAFLISLLSPIGFNIIEVHYGHEGLDKVKNEQPDLIIADLGILASDDFQMIQILRSQVELKKIVIIASSSGVFNLTGQQSQEVEFNHFLVKPVKAEELFDILKRHLSLKWIYNPSENSLVEIHSHIEEEIIFPSATELVNLYQAAKAGYVVGIQEEIARLQQLDQKYMDFTDKVTELMADFEDEAIVAMIQPYLSH